ncbi:hypothetical protein EV356DRAFT_533263 [Viridothelium virens]|uniref:Uncharacterized protein n=1 Tax=Viridothelium virens TaxID=1048519 RepID=A0A6A6H834_VIRVR|nr:hypothetical protein EV356DRAFT_533263 [Viridothelium virens]
MSHASSTTHPRPLLHAATRSSSLHDLQSALNLARTQSPSTYPTFLRQALTATVRAGSAPLTAYLLDNKHAPLSTLSPGNIGLHPSIQLFETLVSRGFDALVEWLLAHGARVDGGDAFVDGEGYEIEPRPAPLTESCAAMGSVRTWRRIRSAGARVGRRALHRAAGNAAAKGAFGRGDPSSEEESREDGERNGGGEEEVNEQRKRNREAREDMLRFLVDEEGLDVNRLDSDTGRAMHWGTPINYAAQQPKGAGVLLWLLDRGADPRIPGVDGGDAFDNAKTSGSEEIMALLAKWSDRHN